MNKRPNIILIMTDQQRYDTIGAHGYSYAITPNLDKLVNQGVSFTRCFCSAPSCVPSRASFFNCRYPHELGVYKNADSWTHSWVELLQQNGYHTVNVGKMHTVPMDSPCGFDQRYIVENKDRPLRHESEHGVWLDEWDKFLRNSGVEKPSRDSYKRHPEYERALGAYKWELDNQYHPDIFTGNMARWVIRQREADSPFFLQIGFPGPHPPYDPPEEFLSLYENMEMPQAMRNEREKELQPYPQKRYRQEAVEKNHDAVKWQHHAPDADIERMRKHYFANVSLIDNEIGLILECLEQKGYLENSIVIFTSDHGDCIGDHDHVQKWTMYDCITRVPMIVSAPGKLPENEEYSGLIQQMDMVPLIFEYAGVDLKEFQGSSRNALNMLNNDVPPREYIFAEHSKDNLLTGTEFMTMVRSKKWKYVRYQEPEYGELYNLEHDPNEMNNLWSNSEYAHVLAELNPEIEKFDHERYT